MKTLKHSSQIKRRRVPSHSTGETADSAPPGPGTRGKRARLVSVFPRGEVYKTTSTASRRSTSASRASSGTVAERSKAKDLGFLAHARVKHSFSKERGFKSHRCQNRASNGLDERECALCVVFRFFAPSQRRLSAVREPSSSIESSRVESSRSGRMRGHARDAASEVRDARRRTSRLDVVDRRARGNVGGRRS